MNNVSKRILSFLLVLVMVLSMLPMAAAAATGTISDLKVNDLTQPLGIDTTPVFRWLVSLEGYGKSQRAYQIIVASSAEKAAAHEGDLWDSGKVADSDNFDVKYAGSALESRTPYYWAVQVWDETDASIGWSDVAVFETGVLNESEWTAQWITTKQGDTGSFAMNLSGSNWIWSRYGAADNAVPAETMYFRSQFTVNEEKTVENAYLGFSTDDLGTAYINDQEAGAVTDGGYGWQSGSLTKVTDLVKAGVNTIAAQVQNAREGYAGFIGKLQILYTDGTVDTFVTDGTWKLTKTPAEGWQNENFDDSTWESPDQTISYGSSPWGTQVNMTLAVDASDIFSAPMLRKGFTLEKEIVRARAYVSGLGLFEMKVNGQLPDDTVLNPAHTQYEDTVNYRVFDVTDLLTQGSNAITAEVGNSFYNCEVATWNWPNAVWRDNAKFFMELVVEYADGTTQTIVTDDSWKAYGHGPVTENDIYNGETYDARREVPGWEAASFDDSAWDAALLDDAPTGQLTFEAMEPMRRLKVMQPTVTKLDSDSYILKSPEMTTGWAKIAFDAPAGTEITITYAERLYEDGSLKKISFEGQYLQSDVYICKGEPGETYEPRFSYKGYEYIQVDGYTGELTADDVECYLIANDVDVISTLETSSTLINRLHENMRRTMLNNMQGKPTDTPLYEKNGWTGDYNFSLNSFFYNFDMAAFNNKFAGDMRDAASDRGAVPQIVPTANWGMDNTAVWNTAYINSIYETWKTNGQTAVIEEHYDAMAKQAACYIEDISVRTWIWNDWQLGDWVSPDGDPSPSEGSALVGTAYVYLAMVRMAEMAELLGKTEDAAQCRQAAETIYNAFNATFYDKEAGYYRVTTYWSDPDGQRTRYRQTSNLIPLAFGLCPEEYRERVVASLVDHIVNVKGVHLDTGAVGTALLLPVLTENGYGDLAMSLMTQTTYPSWGYWVETEDSTSGWEGYSQGYRSRNHYFLGTYEEWLYSHLAGIRDAENGYETLTIDPFITSELSYVNCTLDTVRGQVESSWRLEDGTITMNVTIPTGSTAAIHLPAQTAEAVQVNGVALADQAGIAAVTAEDGELLVTAGSGSYVFTMDSAGQVVTKGDLRRAIGTASTMTEANYPVGIWKELQEVLSRANDVANGNVDQETVDTMTEALLAVIDKAERNRMGNLALKKTAKASSDIGSDWNKNKLTDGDVKNVNSWGQHAGWTSNNSTGADHEEWVSIDLERSYTIGRLDVYPAGYSPKAGRVIYGFPKDFVIEVSEDGENWTTALTVKDYPLITVENDGDAPVQSFRFDQVQGRYVRFRGTSLNQLVNDGNAYRMQLSEIEVYNGAADKTTLQALITEAETLVETDYPAAAWKTFKAVVDDARALAINDAATEAEVTAMIEQLRAACDTLIASVPKNLAHNRSVTVSSDLGWGGWWSGYLTDGDVKNLNEWGQIAGWTSSSATDKDHEEWVQVDLGQSYDIACVDLYPAGYVSTAGRVIYGFPKSFVIEVSEDGQTWKTALSKENYPLITVEKDGDIPVQSFSFETVTGRYLRVRATSLNQIVTDGNAYRMQLSEIEVYSMSKENPAADAAQIDALIDAIDLADKATVEAARTAYDALSDAAKALVTKLADLEAAEKHVAVQESVVSLAVTGTDVLTVDDTEITFTVSAFNAVDLATAELTMEVDETVMSDVQVEAAEDWKIIASVYENGKLIVTMMNLEGVTGKSDLLTVKAQLKGERGEASLTVSEAKLAAYLGDGETYVEVDLTNAGFTTTVTYSIYDVNRDGVVDLLDITRAQRYYGIDNDICDVNGDDLVDILDMILIMNHYTR